MITAGTTFLSVLSLYPVRRRGARGVRVHDARRHHHEHLFHGVHRLGDRGPAQPAAQHAAAAPAASGDAAPPASRAASRSGRRGVRKRRRLTYLLAALLGVVQGLTEFLPISSTAHLLLGGAGARLRGPRRRVHRDDPARRGPGGDVAVSGQDLATCWSGLPRPGRRAAVRADAVVVAFVPALVAGALLADYVKTVLYESPAVIAWAFVVGGVVMLVVERWRPQRRPCSRRSGRRCRARSASACARCWRSCRACRGRARRSSAACCWASTAPRRPSSRFSSRCRRWRGAFVHDLLEVRDQLTARARRRDRHRVRDGVRRRARWSSSRSCVSWAASGFAPFAWYRIARGRATSCGDGGGMAVMPWLRRTFPHRLLRHRAAGHQRCRAGVDLRYH